MFKCKLGISPKIFQDLFTYKPHNRNLLRSQFLLEPIIKSKIEEFSICYRGPHLWNKIIVQNQDLSKLDNLSSFKSKIKSYISSFCIAKDYF